MKYDICQIKNGDMLVDFYTYYCDKCNCELPENVPQIIINAGKDDEKHFCGDCAFKEGLINGEELKKKLYYWNCKDAFQNHYSPIIMENKVIFIRNCDYKKIKKGSLKFTETKK